LSHHPSHGYISTLSLHDALPIYAVAPGVAREELHERVGAGVDDADAVAQRVGDQQRLAVGAHRVLDRQATEARRTGRARDRVVGDRKSTRLNSSHRTISYAVFRL